MVKASLYYFLNARMHIGAPRRKWNPSMASYVGIRQNIHLLDLQHSTFRLRKFLFFLRLVAKRRGTTFFVLNPDAAALSPLIMGAHQSFTSRWIPGVLTNYSFVGQYFIRNMQFPSFYIPRRFPSILITYPKHMLLMKLDGHELHLFF